MFRYFVLIFPTKDVLKYLDEFNIEYECAERWDEFACTTFAVCEEVRYVESVFCTFLHELYTFCPSRYDLIESEVGWFATTV